MRPPKAPTGCPPLLDVPPAGFTLNQCLVVDDEKLMLHCGPGAMFPSVSAAVARVLPVAQLRWITFGHVEADECGSMNQWLAAAPTAEVARGALGCTVSLNDLADRPLRPLADGEVLLLGRHRLRQIPTPRLPHAWEAQLLFDETTATLFCGVTYSAISAARRRWCMTPISSPRWRRRRPRYAALTPATAPTLASLAELAPHAFGAPPPTTATVTAPPHFVNRPPATPAGWPSPHPPLHDKEQHHDREDAEPR